MGTRAAIGVYEEEGATPMHVGERPWTGIEIFFDGYPRGVGEAILRGVKELGGDLDLFVEKFASGTLGWGCFISCERAAEPSLPASNEEFSSYAYCYVVDRAARRLDVFATHHRSRGELLVSVSFGPLGNAIPDSLRDFPNEG